MVGASSIAPSTCGARRARCLSARPALQKKKTMVVNYPQRSDASIADMLSGALLDVCVEVRSCARLSERSRLRGALSTASVSEDALLLPPLHLGVARVPSVREFGQLKSRVSRHSSHDACDACPLRAFVSRRLRWFCAHPRTRTVSRPMWTACASPLPACRIASVLGSSIPYSGMSVCFPHVHAPPTPTPTNSPRRAQLMRVQTCARESCWSWACLPTCACAGLASLGERDPWRPMRFGRIRVRHELARCMRRTSTASLLWRTLLHG